MNTIKRLFLYILLMIGSSVIIVTPASAIYKDRTQTPQIEQFITAGHVIGFGASGMYVVGGDHMLNVEFGGTEGTLPVIKKTDVSSGSTLPANAVYSNLWPGIDLSYTPAAGGIVESIYTLAPGADVTLIRLKYNVPVTIGISGALHLKFKTGIMQESAPVAWQEIAGQRMPVKIAFNQFTQESGHGDVGFKIGRYDQTRPLLIDPVLQWNTFMGFEGDSYNEMANAIALDSSGNIYVTGESRGSWGFPINAYAGGSDIFVAKLNSFGVLQWSTFLGSALTEYGLDIAVDGSYDVYVTGRSDATWGSPVHAHAGSSDVFVAKLNGSGYLQWNTFMGSADETDEGNGITVDGTGDVYVTGFSGATWGTPKNSHAGSWDAFVFKLNNSGILQWNTFMGASTTDVGNDIALNTSATNVFVTGRSLDTWGNPVNAHTGGGLYDAFVLKLTSDGDRRYNTFMGSASDNDVGNGIVVDSNGNAYVAGHGGYWGNPLNSHSGLYDAFAAKLNTIGELQWNTFMGSSSYDSGSDIAINNRGDVYVTGTSDVTWGAAPINAHPAHSYDAVYVAGINNSGVLQWNTFMGSTSNDGSFSIALDGSGDICVSGLSFAAWGSPVNAYTSVSDAFVAKLKFVSKPLIKKHFYIIRPTNGKGAVICL